MYKKKKPRYSGNYIIASNVGVGLGWYDKVMDKWEIVSRIKMNKYFILEVHRWMELPKDK